MEHESQTDPGILGNSRDFTVGGSMGVDVMVRGDQVVNALYSSCSEEENY